MLAPVTGPPNSASSATVPPMASAASWLTARVSVATARITNIRKAVRTTSTGSACPALPVGVVAPRRADVAQPTARRTSAATQAPSSWAAQ